MNSSENLFEKVIKKYASIDILVNNAGAIKDNILLKVSKEGWDYVIKTNLYSVLNLTKYDIYPMMKQKKMKHY